jgi:GNAT superfamily N-acetyltransferase
MVSVLKLIKELALFEKEPEAVEITETTLLEDGFGKKPLFQVFVAELDDKIVGMALFYERYSTWKGKALHLEDLIVRKEQRGKGIGNALYSEVLKYAYDHDFKRVAWEVLDWNKVAIDYYISTGAVVFDEWRVAQINEKALEIFVKKSL